MWCACLRPIRPIWYIDRFHVIREFLDRYHNLLPGWRNWDAQIQQPGPLQLTAMTAVDNILAGVRDKDNVWSINTRWNIMKRKQRIKHGLRLPTKNTDA